MNTRGRPSNVSKGLPETGLLAVRVPKSHIDFIREQAKKEGIRPGELVAEIIAAVIEGIDNA
jgi:hypothetical protein